MSTRGNIRFYNNAGPQGLKYFGSVISIDDCIDLLKIDDLVRGSNHILEIGAGYGRVLDYLIKKFPNKKISGLENSQTMFENLKRRFSSSVNVLYKSVLDFQISEKPDLVLWMWSGFGDLSVSEQNEALKNLYKNSSEDSTLVIDLPDVAKVLDSGKKGRVGDFKHRNIVTINHPLFGFYSGYFPTETEMKQMAKDVGYNSFNLEKYDFNNSPRIQFKLNK